MKQRTFGKTAGCLRPLAALAVGFVLCGAAGETPPYRDASLKTAARVKDLLGRMTRAEKCAQLGTFRAFGSYVCAADRIVPSVETVDGIVTNGPGTVYGLLRADGLSGRNEKNGIPPERMRETLDAYQMIAVTRTRLGIPMLFVEEGSRGLLALGEIVYPNGLGLGSSFDADLLRRIGWQIGRARGRGVHGVCAPILDLARDPRGNGCEACFGEDPELVATLGCAEFEGLREAGMVPCLKHFIGGGRAEGNGPDARSASLGPAECFNGPLRPFRRVIAAGARQIMCAGHVVDGDPCTGSKYLLTDILRGKLGFDGFVRAADGAIPLLAQRRIAADLPAAAALALKAGCDTEGGSPTPGGCGASFRAALEAGLVTEKDLDNAVARILAVKFDMGLFEQPYARREPPPDRAAERALAREAARKALVLLENRRATLPIAGSSSVAIIESPVVTVADDLRRLMPSVAHVGVPARSSGEGEGFSEAVRLAAAADVTVLVLGEGASAREAASEALFRAVREKAKKLVLVLVRERPPVWDEQIEKADAVLLAWCPGTEGGTAVAETLLGLWNPSGRLPVPIRRRARASSAGADDVAYPFGFGRSYTTFAYTDLAVDAPRSFDATRAAEDLPRVRVTVRNTGTCAGDEIVRFTFTATGSGVSRPARELLAFTRVSLQPGEAVCVSVPYDEKLFGRYDRTGAYVSPCGIVTVRAAGHAPGVAFDYRK